MDWLGLSAYSAHIFLTFSPEEARSADHVASDFNLINNISLTESCGLAYTLLSSWIKVFINNKKEPAGFLYSLHTLKKCELYKYS